jgi:gamma-glutamylcyclotransferase
MDYFAYGSNMSTQRLTAPNRVPSAIVKTTGHIKGHALKFNKVSIDGSGKGSIEQTDNKDDLVYGVVYEIDEKEKPALDRAEGLGHGYEEIEIIVSTPVGDIVANTYYATNTKDTLKPYDSYMEYVIDGAKEHNLPKEYIKKIEAVNTIQDPRRDPNSRL